MPDETDEKPTPGTGSAGQTFLVGEHVYLRTIEESDAEYAASWRHGIARSSVTAAKSWIEDDLKDESDQHIVIVRKCDDRPVGSLIRSTWIHNIWYTSFIDSIFGEQSQIYLGEALGLVAQWDVDECQNIAVHVTNLAGDQETVISMLEAIGARISSRFREQQWRDGRFVDGIRMVYLNRQWVETLSDPWSVEKPRVGSGVVQPVIAPIEISGNQLPLNAVRVGPRIYLRPLQKEDAQLLVEWARREDDAVWNAGRSLYTLTSSEKWIRELNEGELREWVRFAVCLRENDLFIGAVGIIDIDHINRWAESEAEFHHTDYRGKGYGTEAKHLLFDYAFNTLGLHSLQSWVLYSNVPSAAALRKQGYREVGFDPWWMRKAGGFDHMGTYELLADEWRAMPRVEIDEENQP